MKIRHHCNSLLDVGIILLFAAYLHVSGGSVPMREWEYHDVQEHQPVWMYDLIHIYEGNTPLAINVKNTKPPNRNSNSNFKVRSLPLYPAKYLPSVSPRLNNIIINRGPYQYDNNIVPMSDTCWSIALQKPILGTSWKFRHKSGWYIKVLDRWFYWHKV